MSAGTQMLLVAAYPDQAVAQREFDELAGKVRAKEVQSQGMILVTRDAEGRVVLAGWSR